MGIDGITIRGVRRELDAQLVGARVTKIYQPLPDTLLLRLRRPTEEYDLLCSTHARFARAHTTRLHYSNPMSPPPFCMLLRKHLEGARLARVEQPGLERVLRFSFQPVGVPSRGAPSSTPASRRASPRSATSAVDGRPELILVVEMMGRHSNVILIDGASDRILDGLKRIDTELSRYREVAPGQSYLPPPPQGKVAPERWSFEEFAGLIRHAVPDDRLSRVLVDRTDGLGPTLAQSVIRRAGLSPQARRSDLSDSAGMNGERLDAGITALWESWGALLAHLAESRFAPTLLLDPPTGNPADILPFTFGLPEELEARRWESFSALFDVFFGRKVERQHFDKAAHTLRQRIEGELRRVRRRLKAQRKDMEATREMDRYRLFGELLTASLHRVGSDAAARVSVPNYYEPDHAEIEIPLDPRKTPSENAQAHFKRYSKLKKRSEQLSDQLEKGETERRYVESLLTHLTLAETADDLAALRDELVSEGYLEEGKRRTNAKPEAKAKERPRTSPRGAQERGRPSTFRSSDGFSILAGRNNRQNDQLTLRIGRPGDLWLHTKEIAGSHVLIRTGNLDADAVPEQTVGEAAMIAAYFSKGRESPNVPVDVTERRHVRKPSGAKPGMVIYDRHHTRYVTPDAALVERLRAEGEAERA